MGAVGLDGALPQSDVLPEQAGDAAVAGHVAAQPLDAFRLDGGAHGRLGAHIGVVHVHGRRHQVLVLISRRVLNTKI